MRSRLQRLRAKVSPGPLGRILFDDSTASLQVAAGLMAILLGLGALVAPPTPADAALYHLLPRDGWAALRVILGMLQIAASYRQRQHWRLKYGAASAQLLLAGYATAVVAIIVGAASSANIWLTIVEGWISGRALYDRDLNGSDRRGVDAG